MKKYLFLMLTAFGLLTVSCGDDEPEVNVNTPSIVGEWSGVRELGSDDIYIHYSFFENGQFYAYMPAWGEMRFGHYSAKDGKVTLEVEGLAYIGRGGKPDNESGNIYRQKYDRENFSEWKQGWPENVRCTSPYSFDAEGHLFLPETIIGGGLNLTYYKDDNFTSRYDY